MGVYVIDSIRLLRKFADKAEGQTLYFDTETTGFNPRRNKLVAMQFLREGGCPIVVDWRQFIIERSVSKAVGALTQVFESSLFIGHNLSFDWSFCAAIGLRMKRVWDTMLAEQVIRSSTLDGCSLADTLGRRFGIEMSKEERNWFIDLDQRAEWDEPFPDIQLHYMGKDVEYLPQLHRAQAEDLKRWNLVRTAKLEMRALPAIADMALNGIHIDVDGWREMVASWGEKAREYEDKVTRVFGAPILEARARRFDEAQAEYDTWERERDTALANFRSDWEMEDHALDKWGNYKNAQMKRWRESHPNPGKPKADTRPPNLNSREQLIDAFTGLGLTIPTKKVDGVERPTFAAEALQKLAGTHPTIDDFLSWKIYAKAESSFGDAVLEYMDSDGRIHPNWLQIGAETGRMACEKPNWQQIPGKGETKQIRENVTPADGNLLLVADFRNIELYILANLSEDPQMLGMFERGEDMHSFTARRMFGIADDVDPDAVDIKPKVSARKIAKNINFGISYGQTEYGLSKKMNMPIEEAGAFIGQWYELYSGAREWLVKAGEFAVTNGYSKTVLGRKRFYGELPPRPRKSASWEDRNAWERKAGAVRRAGMNHPMQGTSADVTKLALAMFYEACPREDGFLVAVVHDELLVEAREERAEEVAELMADCMYEACCKYLTVLPSPKPKVHIGKSWEK